jgi:hypothetical protein
LKTGRASHNRSVYASPPTAADDLSKDTHLIIIIHPKYALSSVFS